MYVTTHTFKKSVFKAFRYLSFDLQTVQLGREENENVILSDLWLAGVGLALHTKKDELQQQESMMQLFRVLGNNTGFANMHPYKIYPDFKTLHSPLMNRSYSVAERKETNISL